MKDLLQYALVLLIMLIAPHILMEVVLMADNKSFLCEMNQKIFLAKHSKRNRAWWHELVALIVMNVMLMTSGIVWLIYTAHAALENPTIINVALLSSMLFVLCHQFYAVADELIDLKAGWRIR